MNTKPTATLTVRDVMTAPAVVVRADIAYAEIAHQFLSSDIGGMPVVDDVGRLIGVITEADLLYRQAYGPDPAVPDVAVRPGGWRKKTNAVDVADLMSPDPVSANVDDPLEVVAQRLLEHAVSRLPVVRDGCVIGIVSRHDVLRRFARPDYAIAADIEQAIDAAQGNMPIAATTFVLDGDVVLTGFVADSEDLQLLESIAAGIDGAVSVDNRLVMRHDPDEAVRRGG